MDTVTAWQDYCHRMARIGSEILADPLVADDRDRAEGLRSLTRQIVFALQHAVEFRDPDFPAFHRYDDDVTKWGGPNADNNYLRCAIDPAGTYRLTADVTGCREAILSLGEGDMQLGRYGVFSEHSCAISTSAPTGISRSSSAPRPTTATGWRPTRRYDS